MALEDFAGQGATGDLPQLAARNLPLGSTQRRHTLEARFQGQLGVQRWFRLSRNDDVSGQSASLLCSPASLLVAVGHGFENIALFQQNGARSKASLGRRAYPKTSSASLVVVFQLRMVRLL